MVGACLYAAIFSNIARLIEKLDAAGNRFSITLDKISEFAKFYKLPRALQSKMHRYVSFSFDVDRGFDMHEITAMLPRALRRLPRLDGQLNEPRNWCAPHDVSGRIMP